MSNTHQSHPLFDVESAIVSNRNQPCPVDLRQFQARIDGIVGKTVTGQPRLRVVWGQDVESTKMFFRGSWLLKYPFYRIPEGNGFYDIGVPRFYVEELHTKAELAVRWEKDRYSHEGGITHDDLGPIPEEGFYTALFQVAYHDSYCCNGKGVVGNEMCLGAYREPNDADLKRIRKMYFLREQAANSEVAPSPELIEKRNADAIQKRDEQWREGIRETIEDFMKTHGHRFSTFDPSELDWGKYKFLGGHSKSGLTKEQIEQARKGIKVAAATGESEKSGSASN